MKKLIIAIGMLLGMMSCAGGGKKPAAPDIQPEWADSVAAVEDSLYMEEMEEEEAVLPESVDESFADFLYNFAQDERLQLSRVVFPLPYYNDLRKDSIEKEQWEFQPLFSQLETYTVLFDRAEDMEMEKDTVATSVRIEWIYLKANRVKRYYFERIKGDWMLEAIDDAAIPEEEVTHEDFYEFYERFANDSLFQAERVTEPLQYVTADPDDEFQVIETTMEKGQWFAFRPALPRDVLTNVSYGQRLDRNSRSRIVELKGFSDGFNNTLYFRCRNGQWKLTKFEDLGD